MSSYNRSTRECSLQQLHPELRQAVLEYLSAKNISLQEAEGWPCCETLSEKKSGGWLTAWLNNSLEQTVHTGLLLTPEALVWVRKGNQTAARLTFARLQFLWVKPYFSLLSRDSGLEIFGLIGDSNAQVRGQIGLGPEPAAQKFVEAVQEAVKKVNPPAPRTFFGWKM